MGPILQILSMQNITINQQVMFLKYQSGKSKHGESQKARADIGIYKVRLPILLKHLLHTEFLLPPCLKGCQEVLCLLLFKTQWNAVSLCPRQSFPMVCWSLLTPSWIGSTHDAFLEKSPDISYCAKHNSLVPSLVSNFDICRVRTPLNTGHLAAEIFLIIFLNCFQRQKVPFCIITLSFLSSYPQIVDIAQCQMEVRVCFRHQRGCIQGLVLSY